MYELGLTGVPIFNTNNNCSSGSSALMLARQLILAGHDCVLALGKLCNLERVRGGDLYRSQTVILSETSHDSMQLLLNLSKKLHENFHFARNLCIYYLAHADFFSTR